MYWNKFIECADREAIEAVQLERLQKTILSVYRNVETYRTRMQEAGLKPEDIHTLSDLQYLPFSKKTDLRDNYPYGMFCASLSDIVRVHASSGTTGKPTVVGYTQNDITNWSELVGRCIIMAGGDKDSVIHVAFGYGLFTGGLGLHYGAERIGASVIPMSSGNTVRQAMLIKDFKSTVLCSTPSYALSIAETLRKEGIAPEETNLKIGIFGAEPWTEGMRGELEKQLGIKAIDIYGLSEIMGPGVSCECTAQAGMHINEDHFLPEIIDPDTGKVLPYGEKGELVFTTITKEGLPLIRYRTGDITYLIPEKCECGRTLVRMSRVLGRTDDMLIIRGVNVFPSQIEDVLALFEELTLNYLIVVDRVNNADTFSISVELADGLMIDNIAYVENLRNRVNHAMQSVLGLSSKLYFVGPGTLPRSEGKAKRVEDRRKLY